MLDERSARVKAAKRLHRRAFRTKARRFLVEGPQAVREVLALADTDGVELFATTAAADRYGDLLDRAVSAGIPVHWGTEAALATLAETVQPQGLVASCPYLDVDLPTVFAARPRLVVVLVHVRDPGNAGTVLRTADAAGADAVVFTDASVDAYNGKCVRSAAGSLFHLPVVTGCRLESVVAAAQAAGLQVLAADAAATSTIDELGASGRLGEPTAWLFGNEAWGLPDEALTLADEVVAVPIHGRAESLNLSVSAALCMYATSSAQRTAGRVVRHDGEPAAGSS